IGHRLKKSEWPDPIWAITILHAAENFSLEHRDSGKEGQKNCENGGNIDQARDDFDQHVGSTGYQREQPFLGARKNLVKKTAAHPTKKSGATCLIKEERVPRSYAYLFSLIASAASLTLRRFERRREPR